MREPDVDALFPSEDSPDLPLVRPRPLRRAEARQAVPSDEEGDWSNDWPTEFAPEEPEVPVTLNWDGVRTRHPLGDLDRPPLPALLPPRTAPFSRRLMVQIGVAMVAGGLCIAVGIASGLAIARRVPAPPPTSPQDTKVASLAKPDVGSNEPSVSPLSGQLPPPLSPMLSTEVSRPAAPPDLASRTWQPPPVPVDRPSVVAPRPTKPASSAAPPASAPVTHPPTDPSPPATAPGVAVEVGSRPPAVAGPVAALPAPKAPEPPPSRPPDPVPTAVSASAAGEVRAARECARVSAAPASAAIDASAHPPGQPVER